MTEINNQNKKLIYNIHSSGYTVKEFAEIFDFNERTVKRYCKQGKLSAKLETCLGGKQYLINPYESFGNDQYKLAEFIKKEAEYLRKKYDVSQDSNPPLSGTEQGGCSALDFLSEEEKRRLSIEEYHKTPNYNRKKADKYLVFIQQYGIIKSERLLKEAVEDWNINNPDNKTSTRSIRYAYKAHEEKYIIGLLGKYGKRKGESTVKDEWFEHFKSLYLKEGAPSVESCWHQVVGRVSRFNPDFSLLDFPSSQAFKRRLDNEVPETVQYLQRYGYSKWNRKYSNYIERDYSKIRAGQIWVSDHAQMDVAVKFGDKVVYPWLTAWMDIKSKKMIGWYLHPEAPNSDHIFQSFYYSALDWGLPEDILIDNGKDYRCNDFAGGRITRHKCEVDENKTKSMLSLIDVNPHFALPYNAQTKPIERAFKLIKEGFTVHLVGYRGGNVVERPEKLQDEIKNGQILNFEEFKKYFDDYIQNVYNKMPSKGSKVLKGKSPDQLWAEEFTQKRFVSKDELKLFCMRTSNPVKISRNGIKDSKLKVTYWAEWMSGYKGEKVYLRRDLNDFRDAWVFNAENDEFIGKAAMNEAIDFLANAPINKKLLKEKLAEKRRDFKQHKSFKPAKTDSIDEIILNQKSYTKVVSGEIKEAKPDIIKVSNTAIKETVKKAKKQDKQGKYNLDKYDYKTEPKKKFSLYDLDNNNFDKDLYKNVKNQRGRKNA